MECFSHSCFSESWGSPILELFVKGIGDLCAQPATARGAGGSITQGIQGHCGLSRLGGSACTVFTCSSLCLRSPSSLGVNLSNLPAELPHLGSVCRNEGREAYSRPVHWSRFEGQARPSHASFPQMFSVQSPGNSGGQRSASESMSNSHCIVGQGWCLQSKPSFHKGLYHQVGAGASD